MGYSLLSINKLGVCKERRNIMDIDIIQLFFMWCTILNATLLGFSFLICAYAGDWVYKTQSKWFPISRETFNGVIYSFIGIFKMFVLFFNLVPYLALMIVG